MQNFSIKEIIKFAAIIYFGIIAFLFLSVANKWLVNQDTDLKIKKELHTANLIGQYNSDLNACLDSIKINKQQTAEGCIKSMNESNLAKLIISWGYEDALITVDELKSQSQ
ncbi:MAG: hypothetical protein HY433_00010 [Candidatus Liptonbacteria bacterium]|nr:hypothetical protein [Candidatus Liptonbacteria bacterium]